MSEDDNSLILSEFTTSLKLMFYCGICVPPTKHLQLRGWSSSSTLIRISGNFETYQANWRTFSTCRAFQSTYFNRQHTCKRGYTHAFCTRL